MAHTVVKIGKPFGQGTQPQGGVFYAIRLPADSVVRQSEQDWEVTVEGTVYHASLKNLPPSPIVKIAEQQNTWLAHHYTVRQLANSFAWDRQTVSFPADVDPETPADWFVFPERLIDGNSVQPVDHGPHPLMKLIA